MSIFSNFYRTTRVVMDGVNTVFSLGYVRWSDIDKPFKAVPFFLGKFMRYVIGFPLGIACGVIIAGVLALINLCKPADRLRPVIMTDEAHPALNLELTEYKEAHTDLRKESSLRNENSYTKFKQRGFEEKKEKLQDKIKSLIAFLTGQIYMLYPFTHPREESIQHCHRLERKLEQLQFARHTQEKQAQLHSVNSLSAFDFSLFPVPQSSFIEQSLEASIHCAQIKHELLIEKNKLLSVSPECQRSDVLKHFIKTLQDLNLSVTLTNKELTLLLQLEDYKQCLKKIAALYPEEDVFKPSDYLPKSQHAEFMHKSSMINQITRNKDGFSTDLQGKMAMFFAPAGVSHYELCAVHKDRVRNNLNPARDQSFITNEPLSVNESQMSLG